MPTRASRLCEVSMKSFWHFLFNVIIKNIIIIDFILILQDSFWRISVWGASRWWLEKAETECYLHIVQCAELSIDNQPASTIILYKVSFLIISCWLIIAAYYVTHWFYFHFVVEMHWKWNFGPINHRESFSSVSTAKIDKSFNRTNATCISNWERMNYNLHISFFVSQM